MLIRESIINGDTLALDNEPGEMISYHIFDPCLILNFQIKLLEQQKPSHKAGFGIFLLKEILECRVVSVHNDLGA